MWRQQISSWGEVEFADPAAGPDIVAAQQRLGVPLPTALTDLLQESDGVADEYGTDVVWPLARLVDDNLQFRSDPEFKTLYMPFDALLFFADAGNGDQFAFVTTPQRDDVFVWDHENDSRTWVAPDLETYLRWFLDGTIEV